MQYYDHKVHPHLFDGIVGYQENPVHGLGIGFPEGSVYLSNIYFGLQAHLRPKPYTQNRTSLRPSIYDAGTLTL